MYYSVSFRLCNRIQRRSRAYIRKIYEGQSEKEADRHKDSMADRQRQESRQAHRHETMWTTKQKQVSIDTSQSLCHWLHSLFLTNVYDNLVGRMLSAVYLVGNTHTHTHQLCWNALSEQAQRILTGLDELNSNCYSDLSCNSPSLATKRIVNSARTICIQVRGQFLQRGWFYALSPPRSLIFSIHYKYSLKWFWMSSHLDCEEHILN